jgi:hypothetical protein
MAPTCTHKQQNKKKKKRKKERAWDPPLLRVDNGTHLHPHVTEHREKRKKKKELDFLLKLCNGAHPLLEATKEKKKKKWNWPLLKIGNGTHQNQKKIEKKNRVITFKLVLPNFLLLKLQALHLSSLKLLKPKHSTCW